jgi:hypothetical protein
MSVKDCGLSSPTHTPNTVSSLSRTALLIIGTP